MKKNVASQIVDAQLINKADGTPCTTGTTNVYVSGDGGPQALAGGSPSCFHLGQGLWSYVTTAAETNYTHVAFTFVNSAAINVTVQIYTSFPQTGDNFTRSPTIDLTQALSATPTANSVGEALFMADILGGRFGTAQAGGATTITLDAGASAVDGRYVGYRVYLYGGTGGGVRGTGQERTIVAYNGTTKVATVATAWGTNPDNTTTFMLIVHPYANVGIWNGTVVATPATAGIPDVNAKNWNNLTTVALPLIPTTAGRTLDVSVGGEAGVDWANVGSPTTSLALTGTTIASTQKVDIETIKTNPVVNAGTITFPTTATLASTTNITAGTITTVSAVTGLTASNLDATISSRASATQATNIQAVTDKMNSMLVSVGSPTDYIFTAPALSLSPTSGSAPTAIAIADEVQTRTIAGVTLVATTTNLTNAATSGDLTATMKTSVTTAATAATPTAAAVTGNLGGNVVGNVNGNVVGSVGSVTGMTASNVGAIKTVTDKLNTTMESIGSPGDYVFTTPALAQAPTGSAPSASVVADAVFAKVVDGTTTFLESTRLHNSALGGKASGLATTTAIYRDLADSKDRITATVDSDGNRSAVTLDLAP